VTVVSNTSPVCYLVLIGQVELMHQLFGEVRVPPAVLAELRASGAPDPVRGWAMAPPSWLDLPSVELAPDEGLHHLHAGERDAIALAEHLGADLVILDEKAARQTAAARGLRVTGLLGILEHAAQRGLCDLPDAITRLRETSFRASPPILKVLLDRNIRR
jgi:predicted nucleic acid-binding protein